MANNGRFLVVMVAMLMLLFTSQSQALLNFTFVEGFLVDDFTSVMDAAVMTTLAADVDINDVPILMSNASSSSISILSLIDVHLMGGQRDLSLLISEAMNGTKVNASAIAVANVTSGWVTDLTVPINTSIHDTININTGLKYDGPFATGVSVNVGGLLGLSGSFAFGVDITAGNTNNALKVDYSLNANVSSIDVCLGVGNVPINIDLFSPNAGKCSTSGLLSATNNSTSSLVVMLNNILGSCSLTNIGAMTLQLSLQAAMNTTVAISRIAFGQYSLLP